ncbi:MAG: 2Fe-2S iron-sulfur cluster binding domain-containing protein, partial [Woeseiaceae bacterium]|nr:2Fe-2S iron-sulfur cluster binding domain-containing protein [Woeseiaceae bacterium]
MASKEARVVFTPSGKRGSFPLGTPVLDAARSLGVDVDSVCGGRGLCGRCQVTCAEGEFSKHAIHSLADNLTPIGDVETRYSQRRKLKPLAEGRRLSCQAQIQGDLVIDVPPESQVHRQVVRKDAEHRD